MTEERPTDAETDAIVAELVADPYSKAEQGLVRFILEGRFGVAFPQPCSVRIFTVLTP